MKNPFFFFLHGFMAYVLHPRTISPGRKKTQSETCSTKQRKQDKNKVLNA